MNKTQTKNQPDLPTYLNYNKLVFHEDLWPDVVGRTLTIDFKRGEIELKAIEGIWSCRITFAEGIAFKSKLELSHIADWAEEYHPPVGVMVLDGNAWYLKLYNGRCSRRRMAAMASLPVTSGTIFIPSSPARTTLPLPVARQGLMNEALLWKADY